MKLLTRPQFKTQVFSRDKNKCVICGEPGVDAHHLLDRKLWPDGGYYLDNGVTLCESHHWDAEKGYWMPQQLRDKAGIKAVIVPPQFSKENFYDKWGTPQ